MRMSLLISISATKNFREKLNP